MTPAAHVGAIATNFGSTAAGPREGDLTGGGGVTVADVGVIATFFGQTLPAGDPAIRESSATAAVRTSVLDAAATSPTPAGRKRRDAAGALLRVQ